MGTERARERAETLVAPPVPAPATPAPAPLAPVPMPPLTVGHGADPAEADADRRADRALARLAPLEPALRRQRSAGGGGPIGPSGGALDASATALIESRRGGGQALPATTRQRMEAAFGTSFAGVRVHTDDGAARLSSQMSAAAFTSGQDIFFGSGQLAPTTPHGERLLAHELAHTLQGTGGGAPISRHLVMADEDAFDGSTWEDQDYYRKQMAAYRSDPLAWSILKWMNEGHHTTYVYPTLEAFKKEFSTIMRDVSRAAAGNAARWHIGPFTNPEADVLAWLPPDTLRPKNEEPKGTRLRKLIVQTPQERGDMHDVRPAMQIDPLLHVLVHVSDPRQLGDAATIVDYYRDMGSRVFVVAGRPVPAGYNGYTWTASSTTEMLLQAAQTGDISAALKNTATGGASKTFAKAYDGVLMKSFNFNPKIPTQTAFALINFRTSGHGVAQPRLPSHPELDTGTAAFKQIWDAVRALGYWPVPTGGDIPADTLATCEVQTGVTFNSKAHPHLLDYFMEVGPVQEALKLMPDPPNLSKRQLEYGLIARIKELFPNTRAVGMRSGGLDALAQAGVPVLSIDVAASHAEGGDKLLSEHGNTNSWMRAAKRELIQPGKFHQVFMSELRGLGKLSEKSWDGTLSPSDVERIAFAMGTFFGAGEQAGTKTEFLLDQPLRVALEQIEEDNNKNLFRKLARLRRGKGLRLDKAMQNALGVMPLGGADLREPPKPVVETDEGAEVETDEEALIALEKTVVTPEKAGTPQKSLAPTAVRTVPTPDVATSVTPQVGAKPGPQLVAKSVTPQVGAKTVTPQVGAKTVSPPRSATKKDVVSTGRPARTTGPDKGTPKQAVRSGGPPAKKETTTDRPLGLEWPALVPDEPTTPSTTRPSSTAVVGGTLVHPPKTNKKKKGNRGKKDD